MEQKIIDGLIKESNDAYELLYNSYYKVVLSIVVRNSGSEEDAKDVFQETMVVLVHKIRKDNFRLSAALQTYIAAISKNIWLKHLRDSGRKEKQKTEYAAIYYTDLDDNIEQEKYYTSKLQKYIYKISKHCQGFIDDVFFKGKTPEQIKLEYGYTSLHNTANQKYKCIEQIRNVSRGKQ